jgi:hypothetical protein
VLQIDAQQTSSEWPTISERKARTLAEAGEDS